MAQHATAKKRKENPSENLCEIHLREKVCDALYKDAVGLDPKTCDVNFLFFDVAEKKLIAKLPAHKAILAATSPVFHAEFYGSVKENGEVKIVDSSPEAFKVFLQCFYLGTVALTMKNIPEIMYLANKYDVPDCMDACAKYLNDNLTTKDIWWVYDLAMLHEHQELKKFCDEFIISNAITLLESDEFLACSQKVLREILKLDLRCRESIVFDQCLAWAKNACQQNCIDQNIASNLRNQLGDCLYLIRFGTMTNEEFLETTKNYEGIFTGDEMGDIWRSISLKGFISKKFNQNSRFCWDENKVWMCQPIQTGKFVTLRSREFVFITSNKSTLIGGVYFSNIMHSYGNMGNLNTKFSIFEIQGQSFATETGTILYEVTKDIPYDARNYMMKLPTPIIINAKNTYQFCLEFTNLRDSPHVYIYSLGEVTSKNDLIISFKNDSGRQHMISRLDLIDY